MELKSLPHVAISVLSQCLGSTDLLSLICTEAAWQALLDYRSLWLLQAKRCGIYQPEFENHDVKHIRSLVVSHMRSIYREIRTICAKPEYAKRLCKIVINDDAAQLEANIVSTAKNSAKALMPIAMRFSRFEIIHSLFTHYQVPAHPSWLLFAIRHELYGVIKYIIEIQQQPLLNDEPCMLLPVVSNFWDENFKMVDSLGRRPRCHFRQYNELLVNEILRCRHPKIVNYLLNRFDQELKQPEVARPHQLMFAKLKRHSLLDVNISDYCPSPNLQRKLFK